MPPDKLRCQQGEWKTRDHFSNRQLAKYDREARYASATPSKTGIRCIEHSTKPTNEATCKGPCGRRRDMQFFSKRTIRHETFWCVECTDWKLRTENGESLPAPGAQLSVEEIAPPSRNPVALNNDADSNDVESSVGTEDAYSENMSTVGGNESVAETNSAYGTWDDRFGPTHLGQVHMRAPHWLIPAVMGRRLTGSQSETSTVDSASVVSSDMASTERGARRAPVPFNAWGPNGEYARMVKTPTVASESTRTVTTARRQPVKQTNSGWAKVPTRKHAPQLPDYLKNQTEAGTGSSSGDRSGGRSGYDSDGLDLGSDSDIYAD